MRFLERTLLLLSGVACGYIVVSSLRTGLGSVVMLTATAIVIVAAIVFLDERSERRLQKEWEEAEKRITSPRRFY